MSALKSTGLAAHIAVTGSLKAALDGGFITLYSGPVPASADDAVDASCVALVKISVGGDGATGLTFDAAAADGVLNKTESELWKGTVDATGTATFFRFGPASPGAASTTDKRLQGTVGASALDDIELTSAALVSGNEQRIDLFHVY